jgi:hypothetical protein
MLADDGRIGYDGKLWVPRLNERIRVRPTTLGVNFIGVRLIRKLGGIDYEGNPWNWKKDLPGDAFLNVL